MLDSMARIMASSGRLHPDDAAGLEDDIYEIGKPRGDDEDENNLRHIGSSPESTRLRIKRERITDGKSQ